MKLVPEDRRPPHGCYVRPIYRDKTNLEVTDEHYWKNSRRALEESRYLIILCSEHSAKSQPVNMEVEHFLATHGATPASSLPLSSAAASPAASKTTRSAPPHRPQSPHDGARCHHHRAVCFGGRLRFAGLLPPATVAQDHIQCGTKRPASVLRRWLVAVILLMLCAIAGGVYSLMQRQEVGKSKGKARRVAAVSELCRS